MSGLLHRLAAQAMGRTKVRSTARLPYAASALSEDLSGPDGQVAGVSASSEHEQSWPAGSGAEQRSALATHRKQRGAGEGPEIETGSRANSVTQPPDELVPEPVPAIVSRAHHHGDAKSPSIQAISRQPHAIRKKLIAGQHSMSVEGGETDIPISHDAMEANVSDERPAVFSANPAPPLLLPLKNTARSPIGNRGATMQFGDLGGPARQGSVADANEVHVSIGCIEVTAVHEASPSKRQAPSAPKAMSLEEYLANRRGKV